MNLKLWNYLPEDFEELNVRTFKSKVKLWLLQNAFYTIEEYFGRDVLCLQETWTDADTEALLHTVPGYRLVSCYSRSEQKAGGTVILAKSNLKTNLVKNMNRIKCIEGTFEYSVAEVLKS
ncbi:hypothetical protein J6590_103601, partial [Homalodisca vitripennis]